MCKHFTSGDRVQCSLPDGLNEKNQPRPRIRVNGHVKNKVSGFDSYLVIPDKQDINLNWMVVDSRNMEHSI